MYTSLRCRHQNGSCITMSSECSPEAERTLISASATPQRWVGVTESRASFFSRGHNYHKHGVKLCVSRFGLAVTLVIAEGPRLDSASTLPSLQKGCGLCTLSRHFVPHN